MYFADPTQRPDIRQIMVEHLGLDMTGFIGMALMPEIPTEKMGDVFGKIDFDAMEKLLIGDDAVGDGDFQRIKTTVTKDNYDTDKHGLEYPLDETQVNRIGLISAESAAAIKLIYDSLRIREIRYQTLLQNATTFPAAYQQACFAAWDVVATATPQADVQAAKSKMKINIGGTSGPGLTLKLALSYTAAENVKKTDDYLEKMFPQMQAKPGDMTAANLAQYFGVDEVVIGESRAGAAEIWSADKPILALVSSGEDLEQTPRLGNTFVYDPQPEYGPDTQPFSGAVASYMEKDRKILRIKYYSDEKVISPRCGIMLTGAVTA